ncbi:MAG: 4'-phosphopantetheinyl transferase superfamily protein, partial [Pedobacter sp.]
RGIPATIKFLLTTANKPYLPNINFNLSHSGDYVVIAIGENALGVDVEVIKDHFDHDLLAKVCFTINERKQIGNLEDFYTFWTRKEALLKATGEGLIDNLLEIECISHRVKRHKEIYALKSFLIDDKHLLSIAYDENVEDVYFWEITAN